MKYPFLIFLAISFSSILKSQDYRYDAVDNKMFGIPTQETNSTISIARFIRTNFKTDAEKFRGIYTWVTRNIKYDTDSMYSINWSRGGEAKITDALRRRKGVCENFAAIFNDIANKSGLISFVVDGYTKQSGRPDRSGHSWCAVNLNGEWLLCDPTWDKDAQTNYNYFLVSPATIIESHMPYDPMWQLLNYPYTHKEFYQGYRGSVKGMDFFNFADSIKAYSKLDDVKRFEAKVLRMKNAGLPNEMVNNHLDYTNMKISIFYENNDMNFYNGAVADFNNAVAVFNKFIQHRNDPLVLAGADKGLIDSLNHVTASINSAYQKIEEIGKVVPNHQYDPALLRSRLDALKIKVEEQKVFLRKYNLTSGSY